jgi:hypothetical protein
MNHLAEILIGIILILLVVVQPHFLRHFSQSTMGKLLFLVATIGAGYYSIQAGVLIALIYIILNKDFMLVESMTNKEKEKEKEKENYVKQYCKSGKDGKSGKVDSSLNPPKVTYPNNKTCNPCDTDCDFEITSATELCTVDEKLRPCDSKKELLI